MNKKGNLWWIWTCLFICLVVALLIWSSFQQNLMEKTCEKFGGEYKHEGSNCVKGDLLYKIVLEDDNCLIHCRYKILKYATGES